MNLEFRVCRDCPVQCVLENRSKDIVTKAKKQSFNPAQTRAAISAMTLMATKLETPCPQSEISRIRRETFAQIDPKLEAQDSRFKYFEIPKNKSEN